MRINNSDKSKHDIGPELAAAFLRASGKTQQEMAKDLDCSQSQVSRLLGGKARRTSSLVRKICITMRKNAIPLSDVRGSRGRVLIEDALNTVWDGSDTRADAIAAVLLSLQRFVSDPERRAP